MTIKRKTTSQLPAAQQVKASDLFIVHQDAVTKYATINLLVAFLSSAINLPKYATKEDVAQAIAQMVGSSPELLDTLEELAASLGNDPNFATTILNLLAQKVDNTAFAEAIAAINTQVGKKVDKVVGKGLSTNDLNNDLLARIHNSAQLQRVYFVDLNFPDYSGHIELRNEGVYMINGEEVPVGSLVFLPNLLRSEHRGVWKLIGYDNGCAVFNEDTASQFISVQATEDRDASFWIKTQDYNGDYNFINLTEQINTIVSCLEAKQNSKDNTLTTSSKQVVGAINELKALVDKKTANNAKSVELEPGVMYHVSLNIKAGTTASYIAAADLNKAVELKVSLFKNVYGYFPGAEDITLLWNTPSATNRWFSSSVKLQSTAKDSSDELLNRNPPSYIKTGGANKMVYFSFSVKEKCYASLSLFINNIADADVTISSVNPGNYSSSPVYISQNATAQQIWEVKDQVADTVKQTQYPIQLNMTDSNAPCFKMKKGQRPINGEYIVPGKQPRTMVLLGHNFITAFYKDSNTEISIDTPSEGIQEHFYTPAWILFRTFGGDIYKMPTDLTDFSEDSITKIGSYSGPIHAFFKKFNQDGSFEWRILLAGISNIDYAVKKINTDGSLTDTTEEEAAWYKNYDNGEDCVGYTPVAIYRLYKDWDVAVTCSNQQVNWVGTDLNFYWQFKHRSSGVVKVGDGLQNYGLSESSIYQLSNYDNAMNQLGSVDIRLYKFDLYCQYIAITNGEALILSAYQLKLSEDGTEIEVLDNSNECGLPTRWGNDPEAVNDGQIFDFVYCDNFIFVKTTRSVYAADMSVSSICSNDFNTKDCSLYPIETNSVGYNPESQTDSYMDLVPLVKYGRYVFNHTHRSTRHGFNEHNLSDDGDAFIRMMLDESDGRKYWRKNDGNGFNIKASPNYVFKDGYLYSIFLDDSDIPDFDHWNRESYWANYQITDHSGNFGETLNDVPLPMTDGIYARKMVNGELKWIDVSDMFMDMERRLKALENN
jgi:hypothetical protein